MISIKIYGPLEAYKRFDEFITHNNNAKSTYKAAVILNQRLKTT